MCACKPGCGVVRGAFVPLCPGPPAEWRRDEQTRIREGQAGSYQGGELVDAVPLPAMSRGRYGRAGAGGGEGLRLVGGAAEGAPAAPPLPAGRGNASDSAEAGGGNGHRSLLYVRSKQQFAAAAGCTYVRQNYCRRCPVNYYQQVGNLTEAVCSPCPFDRPTTAGIAGAPTCFSVCDPQKAGDADPPVAPWRPLYGYTRLDCIEGDYVNDAFPELFPPFVPEPQPLPEAGDDDDAAAARGERPAAAGAGRGAGAGSSRTPSAKGSGGGRGWDPYSFDGPPMPLRVPRDRMIFPAKAAADAAAAGGGAGEGGGGGGGQDGNGEGGGASSGARVGRAADGEHSAHGGLQEEGRAPLDAQGEAPLVAGQEGAPDSAAAAAAAP